MKRQLTTATLLFVMFISATAAYAGGSPVEEAKINYALVEANLLVGLSSDNAGLSASSAYYLGEIKSQKAVIPLMAKLRSNNGCCSQRIMAALSLYKIKDERGMFLIKRLAKLDPDKRVRRICTAFYNAHLKSVQTKKS